MASINGENQPKKVHAGSSAEWKVTVDSDEPKVKISFSIVTGPDESAPDWDVMLYDASKEEIWSNSRSATELVIDTPGKGKELYLGVLCPKGARYDDTVEVTLTAEDSTADSMTFMARATQSIMILKTQIEQEKVVADELATKEVTRRASNMDIYAVLSPASLRGYVFVEGMNTDRMVEKVRDIKKARNFIDGETSIDEIAPYLVPVSAVVGIVEGDIVELVNGPFKGEKARVQQIDTAKEVITVELIEAMVPIPVTVKGDSVRVIEKER